MKKINFPAGNAMISLLLISTLLLHELEGTKSGDKTIQGEQGNDDEQNKNKLGENAPTHSEQGESTRHSERLGKETESSEQIEHTQISSSEQFGQQTQPSQPSKQIEYLHKLIEKMKHPKRPFEQTEHSQMHSEQFKKQIQSSQSTQQIARPSVRINVDDKQQEQQRRLKILAFCPSHSLNRSHVQFAAAVVRILRQRHQVHFIIPITRVDDKMDAATSEELGIEYFMHKNPYAMSEDEEKTANLWDLLESKELVFYSEFWMTMLNDQNYMERLNAAKFDVGMAEMHRGYGHSFGIFHALNLPYTINIKNYSPLADQYAGLGLSELMVRNNYPTVDLHRSFVNGEINYNFMKRVNKELGKIPKEEKEMFEVPVNLFPGFRHRTDAACCKYPGRDQMFRKARYFFVNSQPQIEFDGGEVLSQTEPKLKWIGGIHMMESVGDNKAAHSKAVKMFEPIAKKIAQFEQHLIGQKMNTSPKHGSQSSHQKFGGLILITFGTVVDTINHFHAYEFAALLEGVVHAFPHCFVIWQLTKGDKRIAELNKLPNVYSADFVPQQAILADARTKIFFSHCGRNSQLEGAFNGVAVICVPRLFDQFYNGLSMEKQRIGFQLDKKCKMVTKDEKGKSTMKAASEDLNPNGTDAKHCFTKEAIEETIRIIITQQNAGDKSHADSPIDLAKV